MARYVLINLWFLLLGINQVFSFELDIKEKGKISIGCRGESVGLGASGTPYDRYMSYKRRYTNCTYVDGNLEIKFLEGNTSYDLSFLENIEEVNGYVLITSVYATYVPLINLRIIRGKELFFHNNDSYSLFVALNMMPGSQSIGLKELRFKHLTEISRGNVYFHNNELLCHHSSIHWADIISEEAKVIMVSNSTQNSSHTCGECSPSCLNDYTGQRHCWGSGPEWCQKLTKVVCHKGCDSRCFGTNARDCCHSQCAAGCTGPRSSDCVKCKNFYNEGTCVSDCPKLIIYDTHTLESKPNPDGRYKYRTFCVKSCPEHLLTEPKLEACVRTCRQGYYPVNSTCKECDGPCPKTCKVNSTAITALNIGSFENCTVVEGSVLLLPPSFNGDPHLKIPGLTIDQLDVFKTVKEITGYLMVQSNVENLTSLSFLSNLTVIHGRELDSNGVAFGITIPWLRSLDLYSLRSIQHGHVLVMNNFELCYATTRMFTKWISNPNQLVFVQSNASPEKCRM